MITNDEGRLTKEKFKAEDKIRETTVESLVFWSDIQKEQRILEKESKKKEEEKRKQDEEITTPDLPPLELDLPPPEFPLPSKYPPQSRFPPLPSGLHPPFLCTSSTTFSISSTSTHVQ
jgi:hypothetical protein